MGCRWIAVCEDVPSQIRSNGLPGRTFDTPTDPFGATSLGEGGRSLRASSLNLMTLLLEGDGPEGRGESPVRQSKCVQRSFRGCEGEKINFGSTKE